MSAPSGIGSIIGWNGSYSDALHDWAADQVKKGIKPDLAKMAALHKRAPAKTFKVSTKALRVTPW